MIFNLVKVKASVFRFLWQSKIDLIFAFCVSFVVLVTLQFNSRALAAEATPVTSGFVKTAESKSPSVDVSPWPAATSCDYGHFEKFVVPVLDEVVPVGAFRRSDGKYAVIVKQFKYQPSKGESVGNLVSLEWGGPDPLKLPRLRTQNLLALFKEYKTTLIKVSSSWGVLIRSLNNSTGPETTEIFIVNPNVEQVLIPAAAIPKHLLQARFVVLADGRAVIMGLVASSKSSVWAVFMSKGKFSATSTWTEMSAPANFAAREIELISLAGPQVMALDSKSNSWQLFDTEKGLWTVGKPKENAHAAPIAGSPVLLESGEVILARKINVSRDEEGIETEVYNPQRKEWRTLVRLRRRSMEVGDSFDLQRQVLMTPIDKNRILITGDDLNAWAEVLNLKIGKSEFAPGMTDRLTKSTISINGPEGSPILFSGEKVLEAFVWRAECSLASKQSHWLRGGHSTLKLSDNNLLIAGGQANRNVLNLVEIYNIKSKRFNIVPPLNNGALRPILRQRKDGAVISVGGVQQKNLRLEILMPGSKMWRDIDVPTDLKNATAVQFLSDDEVIAYSGDVVTDNPKSRGQVMRWNFSTGAFHIVLNSLDLLGAPLILPIDSKLLLILGEEMIYDNGTSDCSPEDASQEDSNCEGSGFTGWTAVGEKAVLFDLDKKAVRPVSKPGSRLTRVHAGERLFAIDPALFRLDDKHIFFRTDNQKGVEKAALGQILDLETLSWSAFRPKDSKPGEYLVSDMGGGRLAALESREGKYFEIWDPVRGTILSKEKRFDHANQYNLSNSTFDKISDHEVFILGEGGLKTSYDFNAHKWDTERFTFPYDTTTIALNNDSLMMFGGSVEFDGKPSVSTYIWSRTARAWTKAGDLNIPRKATKALLLKDGRILAFGGAFKPNSGDIATELFDPKKMQWTKSFLLPSTTNYSGVVLSTGEVLLIPEGQKGLNELTPDLRPRLLDPKSLSLKILKAPPIDLTEFSIQSLPGGRALIFAQKLSKKSHIFDPSSDKWEETTSSKGHIKIGITADNPPFNGGVFAVGENTEYFDPQSSKWELLATPSPYITQNETETKFLVNLGSCLWTTDHAGDFIQFTAYWLPQEKQWVPGPVLPAHSRVLVSEDRRSAILLDQIPSEVNLECPKGTQSAYDEFAYWRKQWSLTYQQAWVAPR